MALQAGEDLDDGAFVEVLPGPAFADASLGDGEGVDEVIVAGDSVAAGGRRGRAWRGAEPGLHVVELFSGETLELPASRLRRFELSPSEDGGFDVAWPTSPELSDAFAWDVSERLITKGYCVVQTFLGGEALRDAAGDAQRTEGWMRFVEELEPAYLGRSAQGKAAWLEADDPSSSASALGDRADDPSSLRGLKLCDRLLSETLVHLEPLSQAMFGFPLVGRSDGLLRSAVSGASEEASLAEERGRLDDIEVHVKGRIEEHLRFVQQRKIGMLFCLRGAGGTLRLHPSGEPDVELRLEVGRLVLFRHDKLTFTHSLGGSGGSGDALALQAWMLAEELNTEMQDYDGPLDQYDEALGLETGPKAPAYGQTGKTVSLMSMDTMLAMNGLGPEFFWAGLISGTDGGRHLSAVRWDTEAYFHGDKDMAFGKYYSNHGGFVLEETCLAFDHEFFGMTEEQVSNTDPIQRNSMEVGYSILHKAGWSRSTLDGANMGVYIGNCGTDWGGVCLNPAFNDITPDWLNAFSAHTCNARLSYIFGMRGPVSTSDTACSSSLVATGTAHNAMRRVEPDQLKVSNDSYIDWALVIGTNGLWGPFSWIGLCSMKMLSPQGRCFTFDHSADGFARGEGTSGISMTVTEKDHRGRLAMFCGTAVNQDGRSASMTAPHGPSQQECLRASMREANISPVDVRVAELHGTGTALGDPIEVGALRGVMKNRDLPIIKTSAKSNLEHGEANAGMAGLVKCFLLLMHGTCPPNIHLRDLNPHIDINSYPVLFADEMVDLGTSSGYAGVSSFGFGGTNARGDLWAKSTIGVRRTGDLNAEKLDYITIRCAKCLGWMDHIGGMMMPNDPYKPPDGVRFKTCCIRDDLASYDFCSACYSGEYQFGAPPGETPLPKGELFVKGTWDGWSSFHKVDRAPDGTYHFFTRLGETRTERFYFNLEQNDGFSIFPVSPRAGTEIHVQGPKPLEEGHHWLIDGWEKGWAEGTPIHISLSADKELGVRRVEWEALSEEQASEIPGADRALAASFEHGYYVVGSWTGGQMARMSLAPQGASRYCFEYHTRIGVTGQETFQLVRDADWQQLIYPAERLARRTDVPVRGPDHLGTSRRWIVVGSQSEPLTIRLEVSDGRLVVSTSTPSSGARHWRSPEEGDPRRRRFSVAGSWAGGRAEPMEADRERPGVYRLRAQMLREVEEFQVLVDEDPSSAFYPEAAGYPCGTAFVCGPDDQGQGRRFQLEGEEGQVYEISLDLGSVDKRWTVAWRPLTSEGDVFLPWSDEAKYGIRPSPP